ncbi:hypothetical protein K458DRAFT_127256 [Lentithecium fluviatile CBS 122367]|uniref:Metallo-beta-lactamase domain-containing protein n=1 Tax=Lentithecium fluviatile CBS 122367 TaxID=1168545 RepID=A0A6G1JGM6_9PLEO|nr:hypothetical protein K458DRAFT_127256 [Lentithecium fluviatile CBS 122367]
MVQNLRYDEAVKEPLAQITVVDALHGDCNLVDFCIPQMQSGSSAQGGPRSWHRMLIDTGPPTAKIVNTVVGLINFLGQPLLQEEGDPRPPKPPKLAQIQITHSDSDHIGNAATLVRTLFTQVVLPNHPILGGSQLMHWPLPQLYPKLTIVVVRKDLAKSDLATFEGVVDDDQWITSMKEADIAVKVKIEGTPKEKWQSLQEGSQIRLNYKPAKNDKGPVPRLKATIIFPEIKYTDDKGNPVSVKLDQAQVKALQFETSLEFFPQLWEEPPIKKPRGAADQSLQTPQFSAETAGKVLVFRGGIDRETESSTTAPQRELLRSIDEANNLDKAIHEVNKNRNPVLARLTPNLGLMLKWTHCTIAVMAPNKPMRQNVMAIRYKHDQNANAKLLLERDPGFGPIFGQLINRASVVTKFKRMDPKTEFTMLFTGDAHGHVSDPGNTISHWAQKCQTVDVLKVPHHCSASTNESAFWKRVRANVYLVCGSPHGNDYGNPRVDSLEYIVQGFKDKKAPGDRPFLILFSDPRANEDYENSRSKSAGLKRWMAAPQVLFRRCPPRNYCYELWKLRASTTEYQQACGSVLFGKDASGHLVTKLDQERWEQILPRAALI